MNTAAIQFSSVRLRVSDDTLAEASAFSDQSVAKFGLTGKDKFVLCLLIEELVSNCIHHGCMDHQQQIDLKLTATGKDLTIEISDCGKSFNPIEDLGERNIDIALEQRNTGGLGWHIINHFCEIAKYSRINQRNNLVLRYSRVE